MNEAMEAAARAVAEKSSGWGWASARDDERDHYVSIVRAVLMAVRDKAPTKAMAESKARDDEGEYPAMFDLLDFSGENRTQTVLRQSWEDGIDAIMSDGTK